MPIILEDKNVPFDERISSFYHEEQHFYVPGIRSHFIIGGGGYLSHIYYGDLYFFVETNTVSFVMSLYI